MCLKLRFSSEPIFRASVLPGTDIVFYQSFKSLSTYNESHESWVMLVLDTTKGDIHATKSKLNQLHVEPWHAVPRAPLMLFPVTTNSSFPHSSHWTAVAAILFLEIQWALIMEPTTVGSLWLENDLHENELEFESHMGRSKKKMSALLQMGFTRKSTRSEHVLHRPLRRSFTRP